MEDLEIIEDVFVIREALFLKSKRLLAIADLHLGIEDALHKEGALMPRTNFDAIINEMKLIFNTIEKEFHIGRLDYLLINGDLKHEFGEISRQEWQETLAMIDFLAENAKQLILVKGNHDTILGPIAKKKNLEIFDYFLIDKLLFAHGHKIMNPKNASYKSIVIAHEHPAVVLSDGVKSERYKCFLKGKYKTKNLIVMPALSPLMQGANILSEKLLSPYLDERTIADFDAWLIADRIYKFGKVRNIYKAGGTNI